MDDGSKSPFAFLSSAATGKASSTVSRDYHGPGRGAGNSINALLDAYTLTGNRAYMRKAEELLCRCVHPRDDIATLGLEEPEYRWSYLVFFQVLGKFLESKLELGETDYFFYYARDSLLRYAIWMLEREVPYRDVLDKVELPTETWPAQDIRKSHVLHLAATCSVGEERNAFAERAAFFHDRSIRDLLTFETAFVTRPLVLMAVYGHVHAYFLTAGYPDETASPFTSTHTYEFGEPRVFRPQHAMLSACGRARLANLGSELARTLRDKSSGLAKAVRDLMTGRPDG